MTFKNNGNHRALHQCRDFYKGQIKQQAGYTLFELVVVVTMVVGLASISISYYQRAVDRAEKVTVKVMASSFTTAVNLLRGERIIQNSIKKSSGNTWLKDVFKTSKANQEMMLSSKDYVILFNEQGWPSKAFLKASLEELQSEAVGNNSDENSRENSSEDILSKSIDKQDCQNLWEALLQSDTYESKIDIDKQEVISQINEDFNVASIYMNAFFPSVIGSDVCRYQLITKSNSDYFFDYNLMDGRVITSVEMLD